ncbi:MAG: LicD family protein [Lachnospiraceae bacterium]|nr:LicD family protein [Lachnospiraceae bacterium]
MHQTEYFMDEIRNGFFIPTQIKQAWTAELDVLAAVDALCRKHGILYFADWGSLLGTVRHGGFVPWDDDLDLCMKREDYERFRSLAAKELPEGFMLMDYASQEDHWHFITRVANTERINFSEEHLNRYHAFPYIASVDIFILDHLYDDPEEEKKRCEEVLRLISVAEEIAGGGLSPEVRRCELEQIGKRYSFHPASGLSARELAIELFRLAEKQMARVPAEKSKRLGQIFPWIIKGGKGFDKAYYEKAIRLPFEDITIPVPTAYAAMLKGRYGDYFTVRKVWSGHAYPFFEGQKAALQKIADFRLPGYYWDDAMAERCEPDAESSLKGIAREFLAYVCAGEEPEASELPARYQQLAADFGTLCEQAMGESEAAGIVLLLQDYCDACYAIHMELAGEQISAAEALTRLSEAAEALEKGLDGELFSRREVLFVCCGAWESLAPLYEKEKESAHVRVVALPVFEKDALGRLIDGRCTDPARNLPEGLAFCGREEYDPRLNHPDRIYIQFPYDGENSCLGIPEEYQARVLCECTEELVYVQPLRGADFEAEDTIDVLSLRYYALAPAVVHADRVIVPDETIRKRYIEQLISWSGEEHAAFWERKIEAFSQEEERTDSERAENGKEERKNILWCIGLNEPAECGEALAGALRKRAALFAENREKLAAEAVFYPQERERWEEAYPGLRDELAVILEESGIPMAAAGQKEAEHSAYYGSPSPLVLLFREAAKPVMIADYRL